jgi:thiosulfate/3-mercaptopyruvate sulfurtransferase
MRIAPVVFAAGLVLFAPAGPLLAASPRESLVVSTSWLEKHLQDPDLVLLHVGDKAEYDAAHIPGARYVNLRDVSDGASGLTLEMPPAEALREKLAALGISDHSRIVVYYGKDWVSPSTRIIFTLDYAGLGDRTSLLDGGQGAWVREGKAVTTVVPEARGGTLSPLKVRPLIVNADFVREQAVKPGHALVDARDPRFYDGTQAGGPRDAQKSGHIPGALSVPFNATTSDNLFLRPEDELQTLFTKAGVKPGDTVVAYCHIGQQATATIFAARTLGYKVLLYDGSFEDWARRGYPVENPAAKGPNQVKDLR